MPHTPPSDDDGRARFRLRLAYLIVAIWLASVIAGFTHPEYQPPGALSPLMMGVAGWAFGSSFLSK